VEATAVKSRLSGARNAALQNAPSPDSLVVGVNCRSVKQTFARERERRGTAPFREISLPPAT